MAKRRNPFEPQNEEVELVFGLTGPVGTDFKFVAAALGDALVDVKYSNEIIRLSSFLPRYHLMRGSVPIDLTSTFEDDRIESHQDAGNALRRQLDENAALAIRAIAEIAKSRLSSAPSGSAGNTPLAAPRRHAYILHSLKRPEEVNQLRRIYGVGFFLIAVVAPKSVRIENLARRIAKSHNTTNIKKYIDKACFLVERDQSEDDVYGQRLSDTFPSADLFVAFGDDSAEARMNVQQQIERFVRLIMGGNDITPRAEEAAMVHAMAAALRSGSLARQVGAAITNTRGELLAVGCNDVPRAGGGIYWESDHYDHRDIKEERDSTEQHEDEIIRELLAKLKEARWCPESVTEREIKERLSPTRVMHLLEFSRSLHAEMDALLTAGRNGVSVQNGTLFTTTFPCHECAKLIVGSGLAKVVYIEPYPKSRVTQMFAYEIATEPYRSMCNSCGKASNEKKKCPSCKSSDLLLMENHVCRECGELHRVPFVPFVGVGPRRYAELFTMITPEGLKFKRKDFEGRRLTWTPAQRRPMRPLSYIESEGMLYKEYQPDFEKLERKG